MLEIPFWGALVFELSLFLMRRLQRIGCAFLCLIAGQLALAACEPAAAPPAARVALA